MAGVEANPTLWLRGIPPRDFTHPEVPDIDRQDYVRFGDYEEARVPGRRLYLFGDGSGGTHGADPRRRR
eukprot:4213568-Pyramimonas_sp.AAC.1